MKNTAFTLILIIGVVLFSGCLNGKQSTTTSNTATTPKSITFGQQVFSCLGCLFINSDWPYKPKYYLNFDVLSEKAEGMNYTVSLQDYPPSMEENQTVYKRVIDIRKNVENYTAQIMLSERLYSNGTRVQFVDRVYFGVSCDFEFARSRMIKVLDELGIVIQQYYSPEKGFPERRSQTIECNQRVIP